VAGAPRTAVQPGQDADSPRRGRVLVAGLDIRRRVDRQGSGKLLITPGKEQVKRLRKRLSAEIRALRGANAAAVIARLAPIIRGWPTYYRSVVSGRVLTGLDHHVWHVTYRRARHTHPDKPRGWVTARYFGAFNKARQDRQVSGDRNTGAYPHQVLLDQDRPARPGAQRGIPR